MSDAITDYYKQQRAWDTARKYTCMYYDRAPLEEGLTKEEIEKWMSQHNRTPESLKEELITLNMYYWSPYEA